MPEQLAAASPESDAAQDSLERALFEIKRVIAGQDEMLERCSSACWPTAIC
jgi:hypothetical protein